MWDDALWRLKLHAELEQTRRGPKPRRRRRKRIVTALAHQLDRTIVIGAPPAAVFRFFTDPARWAAWWGAGSTIDARPGGRVFVRYPDGTEAAGEVIEITPPSQIVFTYGYVKGAPVAPGGSRVTIRLEPSPRGTRLHLVHAFADAAVARRARAGLALSALRCSPTSSPTTRTPTPAPSSTTGSPPGPSRTRRRAPPPCRRSRPPTCACAIASAPSRDWTT